MNALKNLNIETIGDLLKYSRIDLLKSENIGIKSLADIERALNANGLSLPRQTEYQHLDEKKEKTMNIKDLINLDANISITVNISDLIEFANYLIRSTKEELENAILAKERETYITTDEAKDQLHVDRSTLWRWSKTGYLIPIEVGGKRLYKQSDIDSILNI